MKKIVLLFAAVLILSTTTFAAPPRPMWCGVTISEHTTCYTANHPITLIGQTYAATDWDTNVHYKWKCSSDGGATWINLGINNDTCIVTLWNVTSDLLFTFSAKENTHTMPAYPFGEITSPSVLIKRCTGPLPITLLSFEGEHKGNVNVISWKTALEINVDHFVLQRSTDGVTFTSINDTILPFGIGMQYAVQDNVGPISKLYYYRLMVVNTNESVSNSAVIKVAGSEKTSTVTLWPNPVDSYFQLGSNSIVPGAVVTVTDVVGRPVLQQRYGDGRVLVGNLSRGIYFCTVDKGEPIRFLKN